ncbi:hypothetical protein BDN71DRAFT_231515 [Pleurotus eryngii]|uniref:Uncharacterized protein n=1 Tax=Pleurotus eryngii TaxID=5323 RepID=A0A9P6A8W5_PLEER|nr:hypothetical protein BDN71DRAFT_231515 [Pleurotus eryngii]
MRAMAANPPRRALGAAKLAARGGVACPRQVINHRPHNPTYSLPPSPPLQEAWPEYAPAPPRFKSNNPFAKLAQGYAEQPRSAERPPFRETETTPGHGDDNDWFAELHGAPESEGDRPLYDERSYSAPVGSRRRY